MNIKFFQDDKVPLRLILDVDGQRVYYEKQGGSIVFKMYSISEEKAMEIVQEVVKVIEFEQGEPEHGVTWRTVSLEVTEANEMCDYVEITYNYRIRDSW